MSGGSLGFPLPPEILTKILGYTNTATVASVANTNRRNSSMVRDEKKYIIKDLFPLRNLQFSFNSQEEVTENYFVKKFNIMDYIDSYNINYLLPITLSIRGRMREDREEYYFLIGECHLEFIAFYNTDRQLKLTIRSNFVSNRPDGIYIVIIEDHILQKMNIVEYRDGRIEGIGININFHEFRIIEYNKDEEIHKIIHLPDLLPLEELYLQYPDLSNPSKESLLHLFKQESSLPYDIMIRDKRSRCFKE